MKVKFLPLTAIAACALFLGGCDRSGTTFGGSDFGERIVRADDEPQNWLSHGRGYDETRFSTLNEINKDNVGNLGLAWSYDLDTNRGQEATPLVVDGKMYTTSAWSKVQAFDAMTGKLLWQFDPEVPGSAAVKACCDVVNRGAAYWDGKVIVGTLDGRLIAIDANTGKELWSTVTVDQTKNYTITGAPRVINGNVIIGNGGAEYGVRGYVSAYDVDTGRMAWRFYTVPGKPGVKDNAASDDIIERLSAKTWDGNFWNESGGFGGGTVWDSMAYDPELDLLYIGVGNGSYWNKAFRSAAKGDNLFVSSIVALRPKTGEYVWHFQTTPGDSWDYTATQHMVLADLKIDGAVRKVIMQAPKNGYFYVLDRTNGKFISGKPYTEVNWSKGLDPKTGRPDINPEALYFETGKTWIAKPGMLGGHNWPPMSFSRDTGLVYIPVMDLGGVYKPITGDFKPQKVGMNLGVDPAAFNLPSDAKGRLDARASLRGYLVAWDPVAQREVWRAPAASYFNGGVLSTAGGLVFQGDNDGFLNAYDARKGTKLWSFDAGSAIMAAPITFSVAGKQYVSVMVGYGGTSGMSAGEANWKGNRPRQNKSRVLTFALNSKAVLPATPVVQRSPLSPPPQFGAPQEIANGQQSYVRTCQICHGGDARSSGTAPDLRYSAVIGDKDTWYQVVGEGILEPNGMVGFSANYSPKEIDNIRAWVVSRARADKAAGE
jgi:alcohol dehydrogenase (cytochrome c)/quinohemoprotein ethanol dehydrogenase